MNGHLIGRVVRCKSVMCADCLLMPCLLSSAGLYGTKARQWWPDKGTPFFGELTKIDGDKVYVTNQSITKTYTLNELSKADQNFIYQNISTFKQRQYKAEREKQKKQESERKEQFNAYIREMARRSVDEERKGRVATDKVMSAGDQAGSLQLGQRFLPKDSLSCRDYSVEIISDGGNTIFEYVPYRTVRKHGESHFAITVDNRVTMDLYEKSFCSQGSVVAALKQIKEVGEWFGRIVDGLKADSRFEEIDSVCPAKDGFSPMRRVSRRWSSQTRRMML